MGVGRGRETLDLAGESYYHTLSIDRCGAGRECGVSLLPSCSKYDETHASIGSGLLEMGLSIRQR